MIKITKVLGIAATVGVVGYLGLAGYVYYHDKQRITMPEQASLSAQNAAVLGFYAGTPDFSVISVSARQPAHPGQ